jgi:16S rRNA (cytosine1402-N4)-methyltransferase
MLDECMRALKPGEGKLFFDGTLGGGGHSEAILKSGARLIAADRDAEAIDYAHTRFLKNGAFNGRYIIVKDNFKNVLRILRDNGCKELDGAILDLGISSRHTDDPQRGFSYNNDGILDMRMDRDQFLSAMTVVNEYGEDELSKIIFTYGEERFARRIARNIAAAREKRRIDGTLELAGIIAASVPAGAKGGHPAKRTFQALRIEVNAELSGLGEAISDIIGVLRSGARLAVISFHSLEDRIVKHVFKTLSAGCICDKSLPVCVCGHKPEIRLVENKGVRPTREEIERNPRCKSATLRIAEKL